MPVFPAEWRFDGVESTFCRQNANPTASNRRSGGRMVIRRGRISVLPGEWRSDGRGKPVFPAECQFDGGGLALRRPKGGPVRRERPFRRAVAGSPPGKRGSADGKPLRRGRRRVPSREAAFDGWATQSRRQAADSSPPNRCPAGGRAVVRDGVWKPQCRPRSAIDTRSESPPKYAPRNA